MTSPKIESDHASSAAVANYLAKMGSRGEKIGDQGGGIFQSGGKLATLIMGRKLSGAAAVCLWHFLEFRTSLNGNKAISAWERESQGRGK